MVGIGVGAGLASGGVVKQLTAVAATFAAWSAQEDVLTAAHFHTRDVADTDTRYRAYPSVTVQGEILGEYVAAGAPANTPLIRGLETVGSHHLRFRQRAGDNSAKSGINLTDRAWSAWTRSSSDAIYLIDLTDKKWFPVNPTTSDSQGGSFINFNAGTWLDVLHSYGSFTSSFAVGQYMIELRADNAEHEMLAVIASNAELQPIFP